jgi:hypothetical protein
MRVNLFMDVYQGWQPRYACANASPSVKPEGVRRLMITVDVPDEYITGKVDAVLPVIEKREVDE